MAVESGTNTTSSWSGPFGARTPTTSNGTFMIRISVPTGSSVPNSSRATTLPRIATLPAPATSVPLNERPAERVQSRTTKWLAVVPLIVVFQLRFSWMTCALPATEPAAARTWGTCSRMASTSPSVSVGRVPALRRTAPCRAVPGLIISTLVPMARICRATWVCAPLPMARTVTTEATPMTMPSIVRMLRRGLSRRACTASSRACPIFMPASP